jgi:hypothetical protein
MTTEDIKSDKEQLRKDSKELSTNEIDIGVSAAKALVGGVPFVGGIISELIGNIIPNQRVDRIAKFVESLAEKTKDMDQDRIRLQFSNPGFVDLTEDAFFQAARGLTDDRIQYIASLIKNSLTKEEIEYVEGKKFLWLLGELNDIEVIILRSYLQHYQLDQAFWEKHADVLQPEGATLNSSEEEVAKSTIRASYREQLVRLNLLRRTFKKARRGEAPEFDQKTGMIKASGYDITYLGRLLLQYIDLAETPWAANAEGQAK